MVVSLANSMAVRLARLMADGIVRNEFFNRGCEMKKIACYIAFFVLTLHHPEED